MLGEIGDGGAELGKSWRTYRVRENFMLMPKSAVVVG